MNYGDSLGWSQVGAAAIQTAGSILNSTFGYKSTRELAKYQNDMNRENWELQNEYNLPSNQVKRLEDAGINPVLAYQNSADASNASPMQPAQVGKPFSLDMSVIGNALNSVVDAMFKKKQLDLLDKDIQAKQIQNIMSSYDLRKKALDYFIGYEKFDPDEPTSIGFHEGIPDSISVDPQSIAYQTAFRKNEYLSILNDLTSSKGNLTDTQIDYYNKKIDEIDKNMGYTDLKMKGQETQNEILQFENEMKEIGKYLGFGDKGSKVATLLLRCLGALLR